MVVVFANNQTLVAAQGGALTVFTDPVPLNNNDRLSVMWNIHHIFKSGTGTTTATYTAQLSNDGGQNWVDSAAVLDSETAAGVYQIVGEVNAALLRFKFGLNVSGGSTGDVGGCCFDLHVNMDHV
jgi:hypothetical protein